MVYKLSVLIEHDDSCYVATCPELDVTSQGKTVDEALVNLKEAAELYLEAADPTELHIPKHPPLLTTLDIAV